MGRCITESEPPSLFYCAMQLKNIRLRTLFFIAIYVLVSGCFLFGEVAESFDRRTPLVIAVEKSAPAVVNIYTEEAAPASPFRNFGDNPFDQFFKDFFPPQNPNRRSLGSGVIINPEGYILTNEHVISRAVRIKVTLLDKREFSARLIGADVRSDLAIIKIDSKEPLPYIAMGNSDDLMIGETVLAIGNPFGLQHTVTMGIISALNRTIRANENLVYQDFIQVDASINPGNSGGPLLNVNGELIGINAAIFQRAEGIGFAIPIGKAKRIVNDLIQYGKVRRGWAGVLVQDIDNNLAQFNHLDSTEGVMVTKVFKGSSAATAGLKQGDVILSLDNHSIRDKSDYLQRLSTYPMGNTVMFEFLREGAKQTAKVAISAILPQHMTEFAQNWLGLSVKPITPEFIKRYALATNKGVLIVDADPRGVSGRIGIRAGDVIRQVNQSAIDNEDDFNKVIFEASTRSTVLLLIQRGRNGYYVTLEP